MAIIKTKAEIAILREGGHILAEAMQHLSTAVRPGVTTNDLDKMFVEFITARGATASFLGYHGYAKSICTSINEEVVHGIPSDRMLQEGDIIGVDIGIRYKKFCTDMARTFAVGKISMPAQHLIDVTRNSLDEAIPVLRAGNTIGDIGATIQQCVEAEKCSIVRVLVGHGVGQSVHEEPQVPNYGKRGKGRVLEVGMVLAVEPMVNIGSSKVEFDEDDGWTVRTADRSLSAHFEDTIAILEDGPEILTR
ncbi:MAG: type I methionyl aminopeptidase [Candidatus Kerfeldbacteria bacterium]|nr:type I methionyl aminopeptidase [Candidatus Kerfeldbacteria bacterium]